MKKLEIGWAAAHTIKQLGPFILTKPYSWGSTTHSYDKEYVIWQVYKKSSSNLTEIAEFPLKEDAIEYLSFLYNKYHLRIRVPVKNYWRCTGEGF